MPSYFFLIFITILIVLIVAHFLIYFSAIRFFPALMRYQKTVLAVLMLLPMSFILANFLASWNDNIFTRSAYYLSGLWMGLSLYLTMASMAVWLVIGIMKMTGIRTNIFPIAATLFILAGAYTVWGAWNARNPQMKEISVEIPDLPEEWKGKKIVQISDVHIGLINRAGFAKKISNLVNAQDPEAVFITGDLFDHIDKDLDTPVDLINGINSKKGIFYITGNHETYVGYEVVNNDLRKSKAKILNDEVVDVDGLKIIGVAYPDRGEEKNIIDTIKRMQPEFIGRPNILLYHSPVHIEKMKEAGVNLMLSGHTHAGQVWPIQYIHQAIYGRYYRDLHKIDDFTLYTASGSGVWGPPVRTGSRTEIVSITLE